MNERKRWELLRIPSIKSQIQTSRTSNAIYSIGVLYLNPCSRGKSDSRAGNGRHKRHTNIGNSGSLRVSHSCPKPRKPRTNRTSEELSSLHASQVFSDSNRFDLQFLGLQPCTKGFFEPFLCTGLIVVVIFDRGVDDENGVWH